MAPGWSIWTDQNDSLSQRDTGWIQFYCASNQEVLDTVIQAFKVSEKLLIPSMVILDAFALSHTYEVVEIPDQEDVDAYLPPFNPALQADAADPHAFFGLTAPEHYFELRYKLQKDMEKCPRLVEETGREFEKDLRPPSRARRRIPVRRRRFPVHHLRDGRVYGPGRRGRPAPGRRQGREPQDEGLPALPLRRGPRESSKRPKKVAVVDRNLSYGHHGIFYQEVKSALYGQDGMPPVFGYVAGLGGTGHHAGRLQGDLPVGVLQEHAR